MTDLLQLRKDSAEVIGYDVVIAAFSDISSEQKAWLRPPLHMESGLWLPGIEWQPDIDPSQRWECVKWLIEHGAKLTINPTGFKSFVEIGFQHVVATCPIDEAPMRMVASLKKGK